MNPHHHLHESTLMSYAAGALPAALSIVAGAHLEHCAQCRRQLHLAESFGAALMEQTQPSTVPAERLAHLRGAMLARLDAEQPIVRPDAAPGLVDACPQPDTDRLPASLHPYFGTHLSGVNWRWMAPGVHCIRAEQMPELIMLKIAPGKCLPMHSHGRSELTQILRGSYNDALGLFAPGDVADLDEDVEHQPITAPGAPCICVSALDAPLVFSGWLARKVQRFVKL